MTKFVPTAEQQAIIDYPPVPLRVVAGAGTGKTTTIVERFAAVVHSGGDPTRALGITFTNKAADELRTRLREAIGDRDDDREVEVTTYHGFASSILDEFGAFVGYEPASALMDQGHRSELAYRVLRDLDSTDLDLSSLSRRREELLTVADSMTANLLTAQDVLDAAPATLDDVWKARISLTHAADRYASAKRDLHFLEYGDLIRLAVEIVEGFPDVASGISDRYDTVLLDEYQDTDPAQRRLLTSVFGDGKPVTAVGDADQTIYDWRGASLDNFANFPVHFPRRDGLPTETLPLSINRRSDTVILALANKIQGHLPRIEASKPLTPCEGAADGSLSVGWFATDDDEAEWIADQIHRRRESGSSWCDVAILCRKRSAIPAIADALRNADIPYAVSSMGGLLTVPEVADLLAWLRILANPADEPSLLRILLGGMFRVGMRDISRLRRWCGHVETRNLAVALEHLDDIEGLSSEGRARLERFGVLHIDMYTRSQMLPVPRILEMTITNLGFWDEVAAQSPSDAATARANIGRFASLTRRWRPLDGTPTLTAFLRYVDALDDASPGEELDAAADTSSNVVHLITAHAAKGLEWPIVFLPSLAKGTFPAGVRTYDDPGRSALVLPYELRLDRSSFAAVQGAASPQECREILSARHNVAEWRLAYVAVTRAKHDLIMTGHAWDRDVTRPRTPSPLLEIANDTPGATALVWTDDAGPKPAPRSHEEPADPPDPLFPGGWTSALRERIRDPHWITDHFPDMVDTVHNRTEQLIMEIGNLQLPKAEATRTVFSTSVTNLVALAECPLKFKWIQHDRLPRRPQVSAALGTRFHRQVELHNLGVVALDDPSTGAFDTVHIKGATTVRPTRSDPWEAFARSRFHRMQARFVEIPFVLGLEPGTIRGKIDAIYDGDDGTWEIVDYKSGKRRDDAAKNVQLEAYALAVANGTVAGTIPQNVEVTFAYFGDGTCEEVTRVVSDDWLQAAQSNITDLVAAATSGPFDPSPSPACRFCDFLHHCEAGKSVVT